ncbi:MAG: serine/threonine-protein kinase [Gemmataceae bacterium]
MSDSTQPVGTAVGTTAAAPDELLGRTIGDFRIVRRLGQGGMGQVYLADQSSLKRKVALKFLRPDLAANPVALKRFRAEAEAVARVTHANIVQVYAVGEWDGRQFMALEYVEGRNLRDYLNRKGPMDAPVALSVMRQVAAALQRAGESGIVHRDIKPENILLTRKGEVKVADFGLSRVFGDDNELNLTQSGVTMGTPLYMSPEQVQGQQLDPRSDIYSFGVTCYHMLAGKPPFSGQNSYEVAFKHVQETPQSLRELRPDLPAELVDLVHSMMAKDAGQRPQTGRDILRAIVAIGRSPTMSDDPFAGLTVGPPTTPRIKPADDTPTSIPLATMVEPGRSRTPVYLGLSLLGALVVGVGLRLVWNSAFAKPPMTAIQPPEEAVARLPIVSENEKLLLQGVKVFAEPKPDKVPEGLTHHVRLGLLYLTESRLTEAAKFFEDLAKRPNVVPVYKTFGTLGLAIVASLKDEVEQSNRLFQEAKGTAGTFRPLIPASYLGKSDMIELHFWIAKALDRNAKAKPLPNPLNKAREDLRNRLGTPPFAKKGDSKEGS